MESELNTSSDIELDVTGVSRSGRVRKMSSKLIDLGYSTEIKSKRPRKKKETNLSTATTSTVEELKQRFFSGGRHCTKKVNKVTNDVKAAGGTEKYKDRFKVFDFETTDEDSDTSLVKRKSSKSPMLNKKKKQTARKTTCRKTRKDKGKRRLTAYMMWSEEVKKALHKKMPGTDFSTTAELITQMWRGLPLKERKLWSRKAQREALKLRFRKNQALSMENRNVVNHLGVTNEDLPKLAVPFEKQRPPSTSLMVEGEHSDIAHGLTLLGESLTTIGNKLKEQNDEATISGIISVLPNSLLRATVPVHRLSQQVDELHMGNPNFSKVLQNIAHMMQGLG